MSDLTLGTIAHLGEDALLTRPEVAKVYRKSLRTLERWAMDGSGPRFVKIGRKSVAYRVADVLAFVSA